LFSAISKHIPYIILALINFLKIWFNDLRFRQCVYDWRADPFWEKPLDAKLDIQEVMCCLQRLFLTLELTPFVSFFIFLIKLLYFFKDIFKV